MKFNIFILFTFIFFSNPLFADDFGYYQIPNLTDLVYFVLQRNLVLPALALDQYLPRPSGHRPLQEFDGIALGRIKITGTPQIDTRFYYGLQPTRFTSPGDIPFIERLIQNVQVSRPPPDLTLMDFASFLRGLNEATLDVQLTNQVLSIPSSSEGNKNSRNSNLNIVIPRELTITYFYPSENIRLPSSSLLLYTPFIQLRFPFQFIVETIHFYEPRSNDLTNILQSQLGSMAPIRPLTHEERIAVTVTDLQRIQRTLLQPVQMNPLPNVGQWASHNGYSM